MSAANCALAIASIIDALENGAPAGPVFFTGPNCDVAQYPSPGSTFPPHLFNSQPFNARQYFCKTTQGKPASVEADSESVYSRVQCPLPIVQSMILPPDISVEFFAPAPTYVTNRIYDIGYKKLQVSGDTNVPKNKNSALIANNIVNFSTTSNIQWGSLTNLSDQCLATDQTLGHGFYEASTKKMLKSNLSCGMRFMPAFTCVLPSSDNVVATFDDGKYWKTCGYNEGGYCSTIGPKQSDKINPYGVTGGALSVAWQHPLESAAYANREVVAGITSPSCSVSDCVSRLDEPALDKCLGHRVETAYQCTPANQVNGTVQNMRVSYTDHSWENNVFAYCSGQRKLTLGGIEVKRYTMGSPICDDFMTRMCTNDAFVSTTPNATKVCACIIESRRLQYQYAGMDLPVQCFSQLCASNSPMVYRTAVQQAGCSAKLCQQILDIHGSDISRKGQQEVVCNDQYYDLNDPTKPPVDAEIIVPKPTPTSPIDTTFFVSLGILLVMVFLIVVYFVRNYILSHRQAKNQEAQLEAALLRV